MFALIVRTLEKLRDIFYKPLSISEKKRNLVNLFFQFMQKIAKFATRFRKVKEIL